MSQDVVILGGARTAMAEYVGAFKDVSALELGAVAGGMENMTQAPHAIRGARAGFRLGEGKLEDTLMAALLDTHCGLYMAQTSDNLARRHAITREALDAYALRSQKAAAAAVERGVFAEEITPVEVKERGRTVRVEKDDHLRPDTTLEGLAAL